MQEKAIFAAGCFWGVEAEYQRTIGVVATRVGYIGGDVENPTYEQVCSSKTGHAEAVEVTFDNTKLSYDDLVSIFWQIHDPTTLNRQGVDIGSQYRSEIFYFNDEQKNIAKTSLQKLKNQGLGVVTKLSKASVFYEAEEYHQQYFEKNPHKTCSLNLNLGGGYES